ncbi:MAG: LPS assembly protein LptD, partial [Candidatus Zixiibacteriota bacterium]
MLKFMFYIIFAVILTAGNLLAAFCDYPYYRANFEERVRTSEGVTVYLEGDVYYCRGFEELFADTATLMLDKNIILRHNVLIRDTVNEISANHIIYNFKTRSITATGDTVTLTMSIDSIMVKSRNLYYNRDSSICRMTEKPTVFINYQDSAEMTRIDADQIVLDTKNKIGYADGQVIISRAETRSESERAIFYLDDDVLLLLGNPIAYRQKSIIKGDTLLFYSENNRLRQIYVTGNGDGYFEEPDERDSTKFNISQLKATAIEFNFANNELDNVLAYGQAYSFYNPAAVDSSEIAVNNVSGDTLKLFVVDKNLSSLHVIGGAEGEYITDRYQKTDSVYGYVKDTVRYRSDKIDYAIADSTIVLDGNAFIDNKDVSLSADRVDYQISKKLVFAYDDSLLVDTTLKYIPVILKDGTEEVIGSYLEYSLETEKGMIRQSKSEYQQSYYGGRELFREEKDVFYVDNGTYTSCNLDEPHFHFRCKNMKMIQGDKVIARPVVFYIEKMPLLIIPYYIFPTKPGRHSGFLSFKFGNFQRGNRFISNVGYYWAASDYWDIYGAVDYYEDYGFTYRTGLRYASRYKLKGSVTASYASESTYGSSYQKKISKRWSFKFNHDQIISPTFSIKADATFLSDKSYYTDYSTNLEDRLNRNISSQVSISKRWNGASLSAQFKHDVALDADTKTDQLPTATLSLSSFSLFGSPQKDDDGKEMRKWYHDIKIGYKVSMNNYIDSRNKVTSLYDSLLDTTYADTSKTWKKYVTIDHNSSVSIPLKIFKYFNISPSINYQETWYKIHRTDQSDSAGIDASEYYRRYAYNASITASTDIYGTVSPHLFGLESLRHVIKPSIRYGWYPKIDRHDLLKV